MLHEKRSDVEMPAAQSLSVTASLLFHSLRPLLDAVTSMALCWAAI